MSISKDKNAPKLLEREAFRGTIAADDATPRRRVLVIGASGQVGGALVEAFGAAVVIGTYSKVPNTPTLTLCTPPHTLYLTPYTQHPTPTPHAYTDTHPTPYALRPTPYNLNPTPLSINFKP